MDTNNTFGKVVSTVYEFILDAILWAVINIIKWYKWWIDAVVNLIKSNKTLADIIANIFEFIARIIGAAIGAVLTYYANIIKGIATVIHYFGVLKDWIGEKWKQITEAIGKATEFIGAIFSKLGGLISGVVTFMRNKFGDFIGWFIDKAEKIPSWLGGDKIVSGLKSLQSAVVGNKEAVDEYNSSAETMSVAAKVVAGQKSINDAITGTSLRMIDAARGWGNYQDGVAGTLSGVANKLLDFAEKAVLFSSKISGEKILGGLIAGAEKTSGVLGATISLLEKFKAKDVYKTLMDTASAGAKKAGDWLIATAATVESFTNSGFVEKVGGSIGDLLQKLKTGLGFGDILGDLKKDFSLPGLGNDDKAETDAEKQAKRLDAIREAMKTAIESIKGVLDDLRNAARDFADSLKDTIVGFAGLKSIELPDGFIPKAKSLIENMNQRLNKSLQFANQIAQLQSLELDAGALRDIIEAGPIKGAQLASSILTGDAKSNIAQINALQKAITYSGAAIGQMGSQAAYGGLIANAEAKYASLSGDLKTSGGGTNQYIQQGAFQINISTAGAKDTDEQIKMITDKIQETFAILAKELAAK
jgi:hypothetical protein